MPQRIGGIIQIQINGEVQLAKGAFEYNLGRPKREGVVGHDSVHGYKEMPQQPFIEGEITDYADLDLDSVLTLTQATVTLELANGKVIVLRDAWFAGEGTVNTEEGAIKARFEGLTAEELS